MKPEINVSLVIEEEAVTPELLKLLEELGATEIWLKGEAKERSLVTYQSNGCSFTAKPVTSLSVEEVISDFWDGVKENQGLVTIIEQYSFMPILSIAIYVSEILPSIHFESYALREFSKLNIGVDVDIILIESH